MRYTLGDLVYLHRLYANNALGQNEITRAIERLIEAELKREVAQ